MNVRSKLLFGERPNSLIFFSHLFLSQSPSSSYDHSFFYAIALSYEFKFSCSGYRNHFVKEDPSVTC